MRKFIVNVNGIGYEVEVEEVTGNSAAPAAPKAPAAPAADFQQKNKNVHRRCAFLAYGRPYKAVRH